MGGDRAQHRVVKGASCVQDAKWKLRTPNQLEHGLSVTAVARYHSARCAERVQLRGESLPVTHHAPAAGCEDYEPRAALDQQ